MEKFFEAIRSGNAEKVKLMLTLGQNVNVKDEYGITPLHMAMWEVAEITAMLISAGANVNAVDNDGNSVLHRAVVSVSIHEEDGGNVEITSMLISAGANVTARNKEGKTALELYALSSI